jgi:site-specific DNA-methyltransferase (adenine-specific)
MVMKPTVICGDCLEGLKSLEGEMFDLALLDPPYFDYKTGHRKAGGDEKLSQSLVQQSREDQLETVRETIKHLKTDSAFFFFTNWQEAWWFQEKFHSFLRNEIIWDKGNWAAGDLKGSFGCRYEVAFLGCKGSGWTYQGERIQDIWSNLFEKEHKYNLNRVGTDRIHSTEKPVDLYKKCIEVATKPGAFVFDPYCGSGSSAEAAYLTGRNFLGYEIDTEYHKRILERLARL